MMVRYILKQSFQDFDLAEKKSSWKGKEKKTQILIAAKNTTMVWLLCRMSCGMLARFIQVVACIFQKGLFL